MCEDRVDLIAVRRQIVLHQRVRLFHVPFRCLGIQNLDVRVILQRLLEAGLEVFAACRTRCRFDDNDIAAAAQVRRDALADGVARFHVRHGHEAGMRCVDVNVNADDGDARFFRILDRLCAGVGVPCLQDDAVIALCDQVRHDLRLLLRAAFAVEDVELHVGPVLQLLLDALAPGRAVRFGSRRRNPGDLQGIRVRILPRILEGDAVAGGCRCLLAAARRLFRRGGRFRCRGGCTSRILLVCRTAAHDADGQNCRKRHADQSFQFHLGTSLV